jgi:glycosyltransferase involved in cell wall biosynthesis
LEHARHTICGNECLARTARAHSRSVSVIPTVVDTDRFVPRPAGRRTGEPLVLGWVGSHSTHNYLKAIEPALATLAHRGHPFRILVVGGAVAGREREPGPDQLRIAGIDVEYRPWTLAREVEDFHDIDIGLFPVIDDDWSAGKSGFKAIQYGATGVPTVTTPVEAHRDIVVDGETGYWATTTEQWVERLEALLRNADLRARLGAAARERIVEGYSLRAQAPRYVDAIRSALG